MNNIKASVLFDKALYKKYEHIYWIVSGRKKSYVRFQLITLAMLIIPGLYFALMYWITYKSVLRKSAKVVFRDHNGGFLEVLKFDKEGISVKCEKDEFKRNYSDFKAIIKHKGYLGMYPSDESLGYCIPVGKIESADELFKLISTLPNYREDRK